MINWIGYYVEYDGYGRYSSRIVRELQKLVQVKPATIPHLDMPPWMQEQEGLDWKELTISFMPPYLLQAVPGRHWLYSMTEGSRIPDEWVDKINDSGVERVLVPCAHNADAFRTSGVLAPVDVCCGGTDPQEFSIVPRHRRENEPYTFLTIADRGYRKGWDEVREAFYLAFGGKTHGRQDVRLIIKLRPRDADYNSHFKMMANAIGADKRVLWQVSDSKDMRRVYLQADCVALPSRSEGWGMPHREAASMGIPVITQQYSGMDDGNTDEWALVVQDGRLEKIPEEADGALGEWRVVDKDALAEKMEWCYLNPGGASSFGQRASRWIRENQTYAHAARNLVELIDGKIQCQEDDGFRVGRTALQMA